MFEVSANAQSKGEPTPSSNSTNTASSKALSPKEELENKLRKSRNNPPEFVADLSELIRKYPFSPYIQSYLYSLDRALKDVTDANQAKTLIIGLTKDTESAPASLRGVIYRQSANALFAKGHYEDAANLVRRAIDLFDDADHLEFERKKHEATMAEAAAKNPQFKPRQFDAERTKGFYTGTKTDVYNLLGKALWEQGKFAEAERAYRDSFAIRKNKNAALGIARAAEKNGNGAAALKYATAAALTGKLKPDEMDYFYSVYAKQHPRKTDVEAYLDAEYRKAYLNPVTGKKYGPTPNRSDRTVLAEFITGSGCVPCIPLDYSFERVLEDYSRKDVILVVYHWHAPTMDPLGNHSSDSRVKYYGVNSAPNLFIDGKKFDKDGGYNGAEGEANEIQPVADELYATLNKKLETRADARIELDAKQNGSKVSVEARADAFNDVANDITLQIALVEKETTYSGENGLRFHPMVVRALAGDNEKRVFGFKIDPVRPNKYEYVFDVEKIMAQNLTYYDVHSAERMREFLERVGGTMPEGLNLDFKFNYKKNRIEAGHLAVVAFLQDNKSKKILQSVYVDLGN